MKIIIFIIFLLISSPMGCSSMESMETKEKIYAPIEASLLHINQKVSSHFIKGIPNNFDKAGYIATVEKVCYTNAICKSQGESIFSSYDTQVRKIGDMFSVMLCEKEGSSKILEDFSCNNMKVEVRTWKNTEKVPCRFEDGWESIARTNCQ